MDVPRYGLACHLRGKLVKSLYVRHEGESRLSPYKNFDAIFNIIKDTFRINKEYSPN